MLKKLMSLCLNGMVAIASISLCLAMLLTAADVIGRYFFNMPVEGTYEITEILMGFFSPVAIMYCAFKKSHISVDILFDHLPRIIQMMCLALTAAIELIMSALMGWQSIYLVQELIGNGTTTPVLNLPYYPAGCMIAISFIFMALIYALHLATSFYEKKEASA